MKKYFALLVAISFIFILAVGCGDPEDIDTEAPDQEAETEEVEDKQVVMGINPEYNTFDPAHAYEKSATMIMKVLYDNLVTFEGEDTVTPRPMVAESWEISEDNKTYTFDLQEGIEFTTGNTLTAEDVKWSFERARDLKGNPSFLAENIKEIETPDDYQVVITLHEVDPSFLSKLTQSVFGILDSQVVQEQGGTQDDETDDAKSWLDNHSAGSGSYILDKFVPNDELILVKNDDHWATQPEIDRVVFRHVSEPSTQMMMLQKGDIDFAFDLDSEQIEMLKGDENVEILNSNTFSIFWFHMNMDPEIGGPVSEPKVQQAIRYALDYDGLTDLAGNDAFTPYSIMPVGFLGALDPEDGIEQDVEKAKQLLEEAGSPDGFEIETGVIPGMAPDGVSFMTMAEKIQADLAQVNITMNISQEEVSIYLEKYRSGEHQTNVSMWGPDFPDALNQLAFLPGQTVGLRANWTEEMNPELAELGHQARTEVDDEARKELLEEIQRQVLETGPYAVFVQPVRALAHSNDLTHVLYTPAFQLDILTLDRQ